MADSFIKGPYFWMAISAALVVVCVLVFLFRLPCDRATQECTRPLFGEGFGFFMFLMTLTIVGGFYWWLKNRRPLSAWQVQELVQKECSKEGQFFPVTDVQVKNVGEGLWVAYVQRLGRLFEVTGKTVVGAMVPGDLFAYFKRASENKVTAALIDDLKLQGAKQNALETVGEFIEGGQNE